MPRCGSALRRLRSSWASTSAQSIWSARSAPPPPLGTPPPPREIGVLLQRAGRSGHWLGGITKGRIFPLTRDELIECAALLHAVRRGELDRLSIPSWPLDILSQQLVAMCSATEWGVVELFRTVRNAYPYRQLPREHFDG